MTSPARSLSTEDSPPDSAATPIPPKPLPTLIPRFDVQQLARATASFAFHWHDLVFELVANKPWQDEELDFTERNVLEHLDGITPVGLLATLLDIPNEHLHPILSVLAARGLVRVLRDGPDGAESGIFPVIKPR